ncbi:unnamed protein product [Choristocarpus tenellus]
MRQLFASQAVGEPSINVRRNAVLFNLESLKGIILADRLVLVVGDGADSILQDVRKAVLESVEDVDEFELKALEALLAVSSRRLEREVKAVEGPAKKIMEVMETPGQAATSAENNDKFRGLANQLNELETRAKARHKALLATLEVDMDLAMMNLTKMMQCPEDYAPPISQDVLEDHEEMELLLEAYLQDCYTTRNKLELLQSRMRSTEALVMVKLDIARNRLLTADLMFSMASLCFTLGAVVAGIFGMNLANGVESSAKWFYCVTFGTIGAMIFLFFSVFALFRHQGILVS